MSTDKANSNLPIYTIIYNPADFPGNYVVSRWVDMKADIEPVKVTSDLIDARMAIPKGMHCVVRLPPRDEAFIETWI